MTTEELVHRFGRYSSWLYYRQWQVWELLVIAVAGVLVLMAMVITRRKAVVKVSCLPERSPIIGVRLVERGRSRIVMHRWKEYLLILLFVSLSIFALSLRVLGPRGGWKPEPAKGVVAGNLGGAPVLSGGQGAIAEAEEAVDTKVEPFGRKYEEFYNKYRNMYALLAVRNEYVELPGFNPQDESRRYKRGHEDAGSQLPDWETGQYGSIPPRRIIQILGPDEMLVAGLISEGGRLVHFRGWLTAGLKSGQVWPFDPYQPDPNEEREPLEVAVAGMYTYRTLLGKSITVPCVVPLRLFREGITPEQFRNLLLTKAELPDDLREFKSEFLDREAALSDEKRPMIKQARL
ncbi:MAG: hypothetical protein ABIF19_00565 [Planctomycetota bacterium]